MNQIEASIEASVIVILFFHVRIFLIDFIFPSIVAVSFTFSSPIFFVWEKSS